MDTELGKCGAKEIRTPDLLHAISRQHIHLCTSPKVSVLERASGSASVRAGCCTCVLYCPHVFDRRYWDGRASLVGVTRRHILKLRRASGCTQSQRRWDMPGCLYLAVIKPGEEHFDRCLGLALRVQVERGDRWVTFTCLNAVNPGRD